MSFTVRQADLNDITPLSVLFDGYRVFYEQVSDIALAESFLRDRMTNRESTIFVAEAEEGNLLGFVQLYPIFSSVGASRSLLLNDLFVAESARRLGVGQALMQAAENFAKDQQSCWLMLQTHISNNRAQRLYESRGWQRDRDCYYYYLDTKG